MAKIRKTQITVEERSARKRAKKAEKARKRENRAKAKAKAEADPNVPILKAANLEAERERAKAGAARRAKREAEVAERKQKREREAQANVFAKRASQDATYRVYCKFINGRANVVIAKAGEQPAGYPEARASRKTRGDAFGLRFGDTYNKQGRRTAQGAETVAANITRKLAETENSRTFRVNRSRRPG
jgi:hypothetical protein